jgi:hypothetical protein
MDQGKRPSERQPVRLAVTVTLLTPSRPENETAGNERERNRTETERNRSSEGILPGRESGSIPGSSTKNALVRAHNPGRCLSASTLGRSPPPKGWTRSPADALTPPPLQTDFCAHARTGAETVVAGW